MTFKTPIILSVMGTIALTLAACGDKEVTPPTISKPAVVEEPLVTPTTLTVVDILFENKGPSSDMTATASFDGLVIGTYSESAGTISDNSSSAYQSFTPAIRDLEAGTYRFSAVLRSPAGKTAQSLIRVQTEGGTSDFGRADLFIDASGETARKSGPVVKATSISVDDGFDLVSVEFVVLQSQIGSYRFSLYPAAAKNNKFEKSLTGSIDVGEIKLERLELR